MEEWKDIEGYEGLYQISTYGNVKRLNYRHTGEERIVKQTHDKDGYLTVGLWSGGKCKRAKVHRLVSQAFIPNPENKPCVNHKDENPSNNLVENLEWMTIKENTNYGTGMKRSADARSMAVIGICKNTGKIIQFKSTREAQRVGFNHGNISDCCKGKRKAHKGYTWHYVEE